jgi:hypothetical protein
MLSSIYVLQDPRTNLARYVGVATNPRRRLWRHIDEARNGGTTHVNRWVATLLRDGVKPEMLILESGVPRSREVLWIALYRSAGIDLTNLTDGGDGATGYKHSPEAIRAMIRRNVGRVLRPESRAAIAAALRGTKASAETRAKQSAAGKGKPKSEQMKQRLSASMKGRQFSDEARARMSRAAVARGLGRVTPRDQRGRALPSANVVDAAQPARYELDGEWLGVSELALRADIATSTLRARLKKGMTVQAALAAPVARKVPARPSASRAQTLSSNESATATNQENHRASEARTEI